MMAIFPTLLCGTGLLTLFAALCVVGIGIIGTGSDGFQSFVGAIITLVMGSAFIMTIIGVIWYLWNVVPLG